MSRRAEGNSVCNTKWLRRNPGKHFHRSLECVWVRRRPPLASQGRGPERLTGSRARTAPCSVTHGSACSTGMSPAIHERTRSNKPSSAGPSLISHNSSSCLLQPNFYNLSKFCRVCSLVGSTHLQGFASIPRTCFGGKKD